MTTELQPSPPGYRTAPGQDDCPAKLYHHRGHHLNYISSSSSSSSSTSSNGSNSRASPERPDKTQIVAAPDTIITPTSVVIDAYGEQGYCKKKASGYKHDSGYSESLGFESFSLALSERDAASPPPTPPVRDASSLKAVCYGPGHEKYPSWPTAPECRYANGGNEDDEGSAVAQAGGSHRSKSWTDHTNYPKEKPAQYTRPHNKRPNATFTQQLKTVMERCEKIPAEAFESRGRSSSISEKEQQPTRLWPSVDREGKALGDAEYVVPSPPERESLQAKTLSPADLEAYVRSYQDPQVSHQVELYDENDLTQTGLEEYTTVQHSQQASYAQSEGYHSYVSSVDSTTTTPFLDRLRRDSEAVAQRPLTSWEDGSSREGRDSVVTTSSGSASSSETLKWHGSMSDVSVSSGMPASRSSGMTQDRWHHGSMSDISSINGGACPQIMANNGSGIKSGVDENDKWHAADSMIDNHHHHSHTKSNNRLSRDSWQVSMNDRNKELANVAADDEKSAPWDQQQQGNHSLSKSYHSVADRSSLIVDQTVQANDWENSIHSSMSDVSQTTNGSSPGAPTSKQLIAHSARVQTPQRHHSESVLYLDRERSQRKLYPVSTTKLDENSHSVPRSPVSGTVQPTVAERISELEKQQQQYQMRYTYLDPEKRHRVSDPTLKAIQKKALLSFYERHHQASWRSEPHLIQQQGQRHSPPPQPPPRPRPASSRRASSASDYASGVWREKNTGTTKSPPTGSPTSPSGPTSDASLMPRHQHSNSCGSLSTDLLGPVIIGPAISIDDWVPERPPKKPHLRHAYSDRLPSPDLPPPSPPNVTDVEVQCFDDPLPPPPPELSQVCSTESRLPSPENPHHDEPIKERNSSSRRSSRKKVPVEAPPLSSPTKATVEPMENGFGSSNRSSGRYSSARKILMNEKIAAMRRSSDERLPDLVAQKYNDSGNQRPAPQVPVTSNGSSPRDIVQAEPKIKRQDSFGPEGAKSKQPAWTLDCSSRQKPRPQVPNGLASAQLGTKSSARGGLFASKYHQQRNYLALPPKYAEAPVLEDSPPPLAPRKKLSPPPRPAPLHSAAVVHQGSQSKASYLAYRRERGAPDCEGSYKRTMSPNARLDEPVLLTVTPLHNNNNKNNNNNSHNNNNNSKSQYQLRHHKPHSNRHELSKSQSSDGLEQYHQNHRLDDHLSRKSLHNVSTTEAPAPSHLDNNSKGNSLPNDAGSRRQERRERLSPQSVEVLNDRNRQLERERRKLAASCEPQSRLVEDFYRETGVTTIEMTSRNVEILNRRNVAEKQRVAALEPRSTIGSSHKSRESPTTPSSMATTTTIGTTMAVTAITSERKISSPTQTDRSGSSWDRKSGSISSAASSSSSSPASSVRMSPSESRIEKLSTSSGSPCDSPSPLPEGLTLVQRTEVVLRVNAPTNDVASQTETPEELGKQERIRHEEESLAKPRKKLREEIECEELSRDLANRLGPDDKLLPILVPAPEHKKSTDYVVDLFRVEAAVIQPRPRPRIAAEEPVVSDSESEKDGRIDSIPSTPVTPSATTTTADSSSSPLSPNSVYFTTSESKARFLTRYSQDAVVVGEQVTAQPAAPPAATLAPDNLDLRQKKEELMIRLDKKLVVLRAEQEAVREEGEVNEGLGARVGTRVTTVARPAEASKYKLHVEEVGKITSLLLGLSGRLARAENALYGMPADHAERKVLEAKRDKLIDQLEEAKILKSNIDRRSINVSNILAKYLNDEEFADYQHFINMKAKLIVESREIQDKVKLGEEQLAALKEAIDL
ncbi:protein Shroom [Copidosoma floridanum]|uniref:protein Shroom n=1 Tax=Copidosoma floridanum TaxID=29053 RepID=UPI000C6FB960|nr:protein Shroom [Copidosoma floridanum]